MDFEIKNKHFVVVGLGKTGLAITKFLGHHGAIVTVSELASLSKLKKQLNYLKDISFKLEAGGHKKQTFLDTDYIVLSPGVPLDLDVLNEARAKAIPIIGELDLISSYLQVPVIAITGTNGKTTTTTLVGNILKANEKRVWVGGNIGRPLIEAVGEDKLDYIVAEISSFQLETTYNFCPYIAVCLNVSEDHLDRHRDFDNYLKCKLKIFKHQGKNEWCIFGADNKELSFSIKNHGIKSKKLAFGLKKHFLQGAYLAGNKIVINFYEKWILDLKDILLVGKHNYQNIMAALLIAQITHCNFQITKKTVCSFKGLSHRLEWVRTINSVSFYNDSKGTNVAATLAALESLSAPIVLVAGGLSKGGDFLPLRKFVPKKLRGCVVIGDAAAEIARTLDGTTAVVKVNCLEEAVKKGWELAKPRGNVLLSPACASFDMFNDYKERGDIFKRVVHGL